MKITTRKITAQEQVDRGIKSYFYINLHPFKVALLLAFFVQVIGFTFGVDVVGYALNILK